jgi:predicted ATPase
MEIKPYMRSLKLRRPGECASSYLFIIPALRDSGLLEFHHDSTFSPGESASGKSSLLEGIATIMEFGSQGGTANMAI